MTQKGSGVTTETIDATISAEDPFMTAAQLAKTTGIPASTWRFWAQQGTGPKPVKIGARWFWRKSVVARFIAAAEAAN